MLSDQGGEWVTHRGATGIPKQAQPNICVERYAVIASTSHNNNYREELTHNIIMIVDLVIQKLVQFGTAIHI